jgi:hypothetical protein
VGRAALIRRYRATFSQREKDCFPILDSSALEEGGAIAPPSPSGEKAPSTVFKIYYVQFRTAFVPRSTDTALSVRDST